MFSLLAPEMMIEQTTGEICGYIGLMMRPDPGRAPRREFPVPTNTVKHWVSDLIALGLFEPSQRRHTVSDTKEYWTLTDLGRDVYTQIRRERLEQAMTEEDPVSIDVESETAEEKTATKKT